MPHSHLRDSGLARHREPLRETRPTNPLHAATYRARDVDAITLIRTAWDAIDEQDLVDEIQDDLDGLLLPPRPETAVQAVPLPPVAAVLVTAIYLRYVLQDPTPNQVLWTLHHYWAGEEAAALGLTAWQSIIDQTRLQQRGARAGLRYLVTWIAAVLESADDLIA